MDLLSAIVSILCGGSCCLAFVAGIAGLLFVVLRRGSGSDEGEAGAVPVKGIPAPPHTTAAAGPKPLVPVGVATPPKSAASPAVRPPDQVSDALPPPPPQSPDAPEDQDSYDDDEMATVVAPPPAGMREVSSVPPPPPADGRSPGMTEKRSAGPDAGAKGKTPAPPPPRSSGQTIIAFDDDDEDW